MNKEYLYLSDKEILVTDENGHATKRDIESRDIHDVLLLENDLERIDTKIIKLEKEVHRYEESKLPLKEKIILALVPFVVGLGIAVPVFINEPNFLSNILYCSIGVAALTAGIEVSFVVGTKYSTKHINGVESELLTAYLLKEELEQRLSNIKDKSKDSITTNIVKSQENSLQINDIIILEEPTPFCVEAAKKLEEAYEAGYEQKGKRLILKK